jgi:indole-3-glycerol phosphate synthase
MVTPPRRPRPGRSILAEIAERKRWERDVLKDALRGNLRVAPTTDWFPGTEVLNRAKEMLKQGGSEPRGRSLATALGHEERLDLIAEIKRASPSAGRIAHWARPDELATAYAEAGADAVSVLTDAHYFDGRPEFVSTVGQLFTGPVLRKDFLDDELDLAISAALEADAVLAIVALLGPRTGNFLRVARYYGLEVLVEVHDRAELDKAMAAGAAIIGINNRNLKTFAVDLGTTEELAELIPSPVILVAESGIRSPDDAKRMRRAGADALLVGESLARDGGSGLADLKLNAARGHRPL